VDIKKAASAGTLESSDVQVTIEPGTGTTSVSIESIVLNQYGRQIKAVVKQTLEDLGVVSARVAVVDKGALDCTIRARTECAVYRATAYEERIPWGGAAK
jgi:citrate lyase subunit gamma (acyl carrier protein)